MNFLGYILAMGAAVTWGMVYTLDQKIMQKIPPVSLLFFSYVISFFILLPFMLSDSNLTKSFLSAGKSNLWLLVLSTFLTVGANVLILSSVKILNASTASILEISYPLFVVLFSYLLYRNTITWQFALGAVMVFFGVTIIIHYN